MDDQPTSWVCGSARSLTGALSMIALFLTVIGCSSPAMEESGSDAIFSEGRAVTSNSVEDEAEVSAESMESAVVGAVTGEEGSDATSVYLERFQEELLTGWQPPGRDATTARRIGVVSVYLGPVGKLVRWEWLRRSPNTSFNRNISEYLDRVVGSPRQFELPPSGSSLRRLVFEDGARVEFFEIN